MTEFLVLGAILLCAVSGGAGLLLGRSAAGQWLSGLVAGGGSLLGLAGVCAFWISGPLPPLVLPWSLPGAEFRVAVDGISAIFLGPIFLISLLGTVYGLGYWKDRDHPHTGRRLRLFYGLLTAGMGLVVVARNSLLLLFGWEIMALSAFFLVTTEEDRPEVHQAGWIYLVATHVGTLCLFALFGLLRAARGSYLLAPLDQAQLAPGLATAIFVLALIGFGMKAGIMPLHVWLPGAHAMAPSHVSALLSGVMIKMGIYGLIRVLWLLPDPPWQWGAILLGLGVVSGIVGVAFAIGQHDLKRLLAYHSIENIGIIVIGLGLALLGRSLGRPDWILLGLSGSLLHVWNHAIFKSLLFLSAGAVIHATHTREIDQLGGLAKAMPATAACFLVGAVAISGLPPLNGFVSEFLIYLGLLAVVVQGSGPTFAGAAFAAAGLALIGGLAAACFVKVYGAVFLGTARSEHALGIREAPASMIGPMGLLVGGCLLIGLAPLLVAEPLQQAVAAWVPELQGQLPSLAAVAFLPWLTGMAWLLVAALAAVGLALRWRLRHSPVEASPTWGCGYAAPSARMQYTSSSFAQLLVGLFAWVLRPRVQRPESLPLFPPESRFHSELPDTVLDGAVLPVCARAARLLSWFRVFQQGSVQAYLMYIFLALVVLWFWDR